MGKLTIISSNDDASYTATVEYDTTAIASKIALLTARIADLQTFIDDPASTEQQVLVAKVRQLSAFKMRSFLQNTNKVPANYNTTVWCADYTTDLTGSCGSIEIGVEIENGINVQPGYESNAVYSGARDGQLTPSMALSGAAFFYNMCMLPGTQKWCPGHRYGTITDIDYEAHTCDVTLDALTSSHQGLNINQADLLTDVPIEYMNCHSAAFEINDEIIVEFTPVDPFPTQTTKVIGFKTEPVPCECFWTESWIGPLLTTKWPWEEDSGVTAYYSQPLTPFGTASFDYDLPAGAVTVTLTECVDDPPLTQDCSHIKIEGTAFVLDGESGFDGSWDSSSSAYYNYLYHTNWINEDPKSFIVNCALNLASMPATFGVEFIGYLDGQWYYLDVLLKNVASGAFMSGDVGGYSEPFRWYGGANFYETQHAYIKTGPATAEFEEVEVDGWVQPYGYTNTYMTTIAPESTGRVTLPLALAGIQIYEAKIIIRYTSTTHTLPAWDVTINHIGVC